MRTVRALRGLTQALARTGIAQTRDIVRHASTFFDRDMKRHQRRVAATFEDAREYDYLRDEAALRLVGRLDDVTRKFPTVLDFGCNTGNILSKWSGQGGIKAFHMLDGTDKMLYRDQRAWESRTDGACTSSVGPGFYVP
jgi:hypothetical protein